MANYQAPDTEFQAVANAIRTKGGTQAQLSWPTGFINAIAMIPSGGSGSVLSGVDAPASNAGNNGDTYIQYSVGGVGLEAYGLVKIDTGVSISNVYGAEIVFMPISLLDNYPVHLSSTNDNFTIGSQGLKGLFVRIRGNQKYNQINVLSEDSMNYISVKNGVISLNDTQIATYTETGSLGNDSANVFIFSPANTSNRQTNILLQSAKLYDQDGVLLFDGVGAIDNNEACIYDSVSNTYKKNSLSGTLTYYSTPIFDEIVGVFLKENGVWGAWHP